MWTKDAVRLSDEERHHLAHVLRVAAGDEITVFDGQGRQAVVCWPGGEPGSLSLATEPTMSAPGVQVTLVQAIPKSKRMDWIVEKGTELGVTEICPVMTERVVVRLGDRQRQTRLDRWQRIAVSAAKQCGTSWVPTVKPVADYGDVVGGLMGFDVLLLGVLEPDARFIREVLTALRGKPIKRVGVVIGPEGDLTAGECALAKEQGAIPVSFGDRVFRVETAAVYALSVVAYEFLGE